MSNDNFYSPQHTNKHFVLLMLNFFKKKKGVAKERWDKSCNIAS